MAEKKKKDKGRKADVLFDPGSAGGRLIARRKWIEGGMEGPPPKGYGGGGARKKQKR